MQQDGNALSRSRFEQEISITDNLEALLDTLPTLVMRPLEQVPERDDLLEIIMDLGRRPEARFPGQEIILSEQEVEIADIDHVVSRIGEFGLDNRAGIPRTLHRISAIRNRRGVIVGLTCRIGRAVYGTVSIIRDLVESGRSILLVGRPGVGKTTMLREVARVLSDDLSKRVIIVDTSNEIAGDGDIPHPAIGRSRRMQVPTPSLQHAVMIEAVENHMPQVIVIDEIGTDLEAAAARTIAERGVQLVATAHGNTLENLMLNPTLSDLVGGIQSVTLGDEEARRRGTQKSILERKLPPSFDVLVEIQDWNRVAVHKDVAEVVDCTLRAQPVQLEIRSRTQQGEVLIERVRELRLLTPPLSDQRKTKRRDAAERPSALTDASGVLEEALGNTPAGVVSDRNSPLKIYPFGIGRNRLQQAIQQLGAPATVVRELSQADVVLTVKNYYRKRPQALAAAEEHGTPVYVIRGNTPNHMESLLRGMFGISDKTSAVAEAMNEAEQAITQVLGQNEQIDLTPQIPYIRRLQHKLAESYNVGSRSTGHDPFRRVRLFHREGD
jgi:stage III sporulation protein SpoIIIAA